MEQLEVFTLEYNGENIECRDTEEVIHKLENDADFFKKYVELQISKGSKGTSTIDSNEQDTENFIWTRGANMLLIQLYKEQKDKFRDPKCKKKLLWSKIKQEFKLKGYTVTEDGLDRKFRNLKKTYKSIKDNNKKSTTGRGRMNWEYYNEFEEIFCDDRTIHFGPLLSSMPSTSRVELRYDIEKGESEISVESTPTKKVEIKVQNEPNTPTTSRSKGKRLQEHRKRQLDIEDQRLQELKKLRVAIERSNEIQEARNDILKQLLAQKCEDK